MKSIFKYLSFTMYISAFIHFVWFFFLSISHFEFWKISIVYLILYGISYCFMIRLPSSKLESTIASIFILLSSIILMCILVLYILYSSYNMIFIRFILSFVLGIIFQAIHNTK